jgi:hypothetical protein
VSAVRNRLRLSREKSLAIVGVLLVGLAAGGYLVWRARWHISRKAIEMADPTVRKWARDEVFRLSHGAYTLTASTILVDEVHRSISVDSIIITTDSLKAIAAESPLPILSLQFHKCALTGIDLTRLAAGRGLHVGHAGCESVVSSANLATLVNGPDSARATDSTTFLTLTRDLRLPRQIPSVDVDVVAFPTVALSLVMQSSSARRTTLGLDRLAVRLDSVHYDPGQPARERRTLLSRHAFVTLEHFSGSREDASRLDVDHLSLDLSQQSLLLDGFNFEPLPGRRTDSLGFETLDVRHLRVGGVDWRALLATGAVQVARVELDTAIIGLSPQHASTERGLAFPRPTLETTLRAIDRVIRVDSLTARALSLTTRPGRNGPGSRISVAELMLARVDVRADNAAWASAFPVGRITMTASGLAQQSGTDRMELAHLGLDVPAQTLHAEGFRAGPTGTDAEFRKRSRYAHDRVVISVDSVRGLGAEFLEYIRRGRYRLRRAEVTGFALDVLAEDELPSDPASRGKHRTPQGALRAMGIDYRLDTILVSGRLALREREKDAASPGVLTFDRVKAVFLNATNDPVRMTDSTPLRITIDARMMQASSVRIDATMPLLAPDFRMDWRATIGAMPAAGFNPFIVNAVGMKFQGGEILGIHIASTVRNGRARGSIEPRWRGLQVEFPGVARKDTGLFGGIKRGLAKFAANAFAVRDDNMATPDHPALNATIDHRWSPSEALPAFIWLCLRDPLLPLLKH